MSHIFPRHANAAPPVAMGGEGCYLIDGTGKRYLDGSGGAAEDLANLLIANAPGNLDRVYPVSGGSEATEQVAYLMG